MTAAFNEETALRASTLLLTALLLLGLTAPSRAGLFELPFDPITRHRDCAAEPCRGNHLAYRDVFVRDRYLRFDIHTRPARYALGRQRVLAVSSAGRYRDSARVHYLWVTRPVLVQPARSYVTRRQPHTAYYPETIVVYHN